jgi:hypothetical protein
MEPTANSTKPTATTTPTITKPHDENPGYNGYYIAYNGDNLNGDRHIQVLRNEIQLRTTFSGRLRHSPTST